ncbi:MAG: DUF1819 family protein [Alphaproteobacteria bacterium]
MGKQNANYKMSFSTGGLFINESIELARLYQQLPEKDWKQALSVGLEVGLTSLPKSKSNHRTLGEIKNRLICLTDAEIDYLCDEADRQDQANILWLAACRAYRLVREFAVEVIREQYLSYQLDLTLESFDRLFEAKAEWDEDLAALNETTLLRCRQVLFKLMREASIISDDRKILTSYISPALRNLILRNNPADLAIYPGQPLEGENS